MQNISKNLWFSIFNIVITTIVTLFSIKLLLAGLGAEKFGLFAIVTILNSLSSLLSFGLNYTLLHYLPKQGKCNESNLDIKVVLILSFSISIILAALLFLFAPQLSSLINVPLKLRDELIVFIKYIAGTIIFLFPIQILLAVFDAEHKNFISNILQAVFTIIYNAVLALLSLRSNNLEDFGKALIILYPIWYVVLVIVFFKIWGSLRTEHFSGNFLRVAKKHTKTGVTYFLTNLLGYFNEPVSKLLIARYIGLDVVAFFDIGMRVKNQIWGLFSKLTYPLLPLFSSIKDKIQIKSLIVSLTGIIFILASIITLYFFVEGDFLVSAWLHNNSAVAADFVTMSVGAYLMFSAVIFPIYYYFISENKAKYLSIIQLVGSFFNIILFFGFKAIFKTYTIMFSQAICLFLSACISIFLYYKYTNGFKNSEKKIIGNAVILVIPFLIIASVLFGIKQYIGNAYNGYFFIATAIIFLLLSLFTIRRKLFVNNFLMTPLFANNKWINKFFIKA